MAIADKTRKLLWGKSGNRCAQCYRLLSVEATELDDPAVVGDECHIVSGKPDGPRHDPSFPPEDIDGYPNLILLCRVDHKTVDDQWRTFDVVTLTRLKDDHERKIARATAHPPVDDVDTADAAELLDGYVRAFRAFHTSDLPALIPTPIRLDGAAATSSQLIAIGAAGHVVVTGVSGCGKSHLLRHLAVRAADHGALPVFARASVFSGNVEQLLDRAVAPFRNTSYDALRRAAASTGLRLWIIVDALNDCPPALRDLLRESLLALARKIDHIVCVSSTDDPHLTMPLGGRAVEFIPLADADRAAVFALYSPGAKVLPGALTAFTTPLLLALAAETVGTTEAPVTSYELIGRFSAKRLQRAERPAQANALLQRVAEEMGRTFRATTSFRTLSCLAEQSASPNPLDDIDSVLQVGLLQRYGSDVTFLHEQVELYFEAEAFIRTHRGDALAQIAVPEKRRLAPFVLGGLDDPQDVRTCCVALQDQAVVCGMLSGEYGPRARAVAIRDASALLITATRTIQAASVSAHRKSPTYAYPPVTVTLENVPALEPYEDAIFGAVGASVRHGILLDEVLALLDATVKVVYAAIERRHRESVFADLFVLGGGDRPPLPASILMRAAASGYFSQSGDARQLVSRLEPLSASTDAALYLGCVILRHSDLAASDALRLFREAWARGVYHLRLSAIELLESRRSVANDAEIEDIRAALEACPSDNIMLNGAIIEAMLAYGMVESPVSEDAATEAFAELLKMPDRDEAHEVAAGLISNCFEEVYQGAYFTALEALAPPEQVTVFTRAALSTTPSFNIDWILDRLVKLADPRALPAYVHLATVDPTESSVPQASTAAFFVSVAACARLNHPFMTFPALSRNHEAWRLLAEIVYLTNGGKTDRSTEELWRVLTTSFAQEAIEPLKDLEQGLWRGEERAGLRLDLAATYPDEYRRLMEKVARGGMVVTSIKPLRAPWLVEEAGRFVLGKLARLGGPASVEILRPLVPDPQWGVAAVDAIRAIQSRC